MVMAVVKRNTSLNMRAKRSRTKVPEKVVAGWRTLPQ